MKNTSNMIKCAIMCAMCAVISQIAIPLPPIPLTFQCFAISLCGFLLGRRWGSTAVIIYILLGVCGVPVFSGFRGGVQAITSPSGGFILGFIPFVLLCTDKRGVKYILTALCGLVICHASGILYFSYLYKQSLILSALLVSLPYLWKDVLLVLWAYFIAVKTEKRLKK